MSPQVPENQRPAGEMLNYASRPPALPPKPSMGLAVASLVCASVPLAGVVMLLRSRYGGRGRLLPGFDGELAAVALAIIGVLAMSLGLFYGMAARPLAASNRDYRALRFAKIGILLNSLWIVGSLGMVAEDYLFRAHKTRREVLKTEQSGAASARAIIDWARMEGVFPDHYNAPGFVYHGGGLHTGAALDAVASRVILLTSDDQREGRSVLVFADGHSERPTLAALQIAQDDSAAARSTLSPTPPVTVKPAPVPTTHRLKVE